jgi:hypothetical protein
VESLSKVERLQWRRNKVLELSSQGRSQIEDKKTKSEEEASNFVIAYFLLLTIHIQSLINLTRPFSSECFFAASVTLFHISSCLGLV